MPAPVSSPVAVARPKRQSRARPTSARSRRAQQHSTRRWWILGLALVIGATVVIGLRMYGIRPRSTKIVSVRVTGGANAEGARKDAATVATAASNACQHPEGVVASVLGERGPSSVVVIASSDSGPQRRFTVDCGTGHVIETS
jgi:hypothetical protein